MRFRQKTESKKNQTVKKSLINQLCNVDLLRGLVLNSHLLIKI